MKNKIVFTIISFLMILSLCACHTTTGHATFNGNRTGNDNQFMMDYSILNKSDSQNLALVKGDILDVQIVSKSGKVAITIQKDGSDPVYRSDNAPTSAFEVTIPEDGTYKITVTGEQAKGSVSFIKQEN